MYDVQGEAVTDWLSAKLANRCPDYGCTEPSLPDNCRCERHRDEQRDRNKKHMQWRRLMQRVQLGLGL